ISARPARALRPSRPQPRPSRATPHNHGHRSGDGRLAALAWPPSRMAVADSGRMPYTSHLGGFVMPAHSIGSGTISFGLVAIPIKLYTAAGSAGVSFHLLHATCGTRIRQQMYCPVDHAVVERSELVKGYEVAKDQNVPVTDR